MSLIIEFPKDLEAALAERARAAGIPVERFVADLVGRAVERTRRDAAADIGRQLDSIASQVLSETMPDEMDEALAAALAATRPRRHWDS